MKSTATFILLAFVLALVAQSNTKNVADLCRKQWWKRASFITIKPQYEECVRNIIRQGISKLTMRRFNAGRVKCNRCFFRRFGAARNRICYKNCMESFLNDFTVRQGRRLRRFFVSQRKRMCRNQCGNILGLVGEEKRECVRKCIE